MIKMSITIGKVLGKFRKQSGLSQIEVAERMKLSVKSGRKYISRLENEQIKQPFLNTILVYLDAIGVSWATFFNELSILRSKQSHAEIMSKVKLPVGYRLQKKLDRDTLLYETKIKPPQNYYTKVDLELVKKKIEKKVKTYCQILQMKDDLVPICLAFANEICAELVSASPTLKYKPIIDKYTISGIKVGYLHRIMNIVNKTYHTEEKKIAKKKPLRLEKAKEMAVKYLRSRVKIEPIQAKVSKLLGEHNLADTVWYNSYMNFARECFGKIRKYYVKDPLLLQQQLAESIKVWLKSGLKQEILGKIKDTVIAHFEPPKPT